MPDAQQQLRSALDALDRAFAGQEPFPVQGCTHCYAEEDLTELSAPLHLISDGMISAVAGEASNHWDDFPRLFRRLTPRIIRSAVTGRLHVAPNLVASRLLEAGWADWDEPLADALRDVWAAWWRATLATHPGSGPIRDTLSLITVSTDTLRPWLDSWAATRTPAADAHLSDFLHDVMLEYEISDLSLGFYGEYHATDELLDWFLTAVPDRLDATRLGELRALARHLADSPRGESPVAEDGPDPSPASWARRLTWALGRARPTAGGARAVTRTRARSVRRWRW